jgi:hypothetical protein
MPPLSQHCATKNRLSSFFNIEKLKQNDSAEIKKVAKYYAGKQLTNKQVGQIAYYAKPSLDAIQSIAKEISMPIRFVAKLKGHVSPLIRLMAHCKWVFTAIPP